LYASFCNRMRVAFEEGGIVWFPFAFFFGALGVAMRSQRTSRVLPEKQTISVPGLENNHKSVVVCTLTDQHWRSGMMRFLDWFWRLLLALWLRPKERIILVHGLENVQKSKLVAELPNECIGNVKFQAFDLGGHQNVTRGCKDYYAKVDGIVYLVDVAERKEFAESKEELDKLLSVDSQVPVLILGNTTGNLSVEVQTGSPVIMISVETPAPEDELRNSLGLRNYTTGKGKVNLGETKKRPIKVFMWHTGKKMGYEEGFKWLSQHMK
jgi:GTP-binding protein SAR1